MTFSTRLFFVTRPTKTTGTDLLDMSFFILFNKKGSWTVNHILFMNVNNALKALISQVSGQYHGKPRKKGTDRQTTMKYGNQNAGDMRGVYT